MKRTQLVCELKSVDQNVNDLRVKSGFNLIVGRNKHCGIRDIRCSRKLFDIYVTEDYVFVTDLRTNRTRLLQEGDSLSGPGFDYRIYISRQAIGDSADEVERHSDSENEIEQMISKKSKIEAEWQAIEDNSVHVCKFLGGGEPKTKIAAFDFDSTLVVTKSGKKFAEDENDWKLFSPLIVDRIHSYIKTHRFVIFTNQSGISRGHQTLKSFQKRIEAALSKINRPCLVFAAVRDNIFRKPRPGMFYLLENEFNEGVEIDLSSSFYIGDAAGRKTNLVKDHSCADILFALNNNFKWFQVPEDFVAKRQMPTVEEAINRIYKTNLPHFDPRTLNEIDHLAIEKVSNGEEIKLKDINDLMNVVKTNFIIFIGLAGSGKSFFFKTHLENRGFKEICRDKLGTIERCEKELRILLKDDKNAKVVINNTNVDENSRRKWVTEIGEEKDIAVFYFNVTLPQALHQNQFRRLMNQLQPENENKAVPEMISKTFYKMKFKLDIIFPFIFSCLFHHLKCLKQSPESGYLPPLPPYEPPFQAEKTQPVEFNEPTFKSKSAPQQYPERMPPYEMASPPAAPLPASSPPLPPPLLAQPPLLIPMDRKARYPMIVQVAPMYPNPYEYSYPSYQAYPYPFAVPYSYPYSPSYPTSLFNPMENGDEEEEEARHKKRKGKRRRKSEGEEEESDKDERKKSRKDRQVEDDEEEREFYDPVFKTKKKNRKNFDR
ncbi:bifunctional polynucleotide phosphatase/kinase-like protein [Dinothrombium tinctorium]|uniref:Bifunctional polynucleotide phosphatase/kinase-like protein n=1 Tax=Dinothrombium tinctorium TaxID=1965070 RepID=A0A3S3RUC5_9ACAR|nr:bifunctional polynucleotide phosphatase/kinase-like protein [Dinothrombium tinctorium]RWS06173.1 bifunctional polynucleotide phosphatase/kinase-like protein [Dinothrombium tinctorium]